MVAARYTELFAELQVHPSSSTPDPEIETMLTEEELNVPLALLELEVWNLAEDREDKDLDKL